MTAEEVKSVIDEQRAQGLSDEQMLDAFYSMFKDGKMDKEDLRNVIGVLGYEFTPEFEQDNTEAPIDALKQGQGEEGTENVTAEEVEDAKEFEPGEGEEGTETTEEETNEEERTIDEDEEGEGHSPDEEEVPTSEEDSEEDEKSKARKLFGLD